MKLDLGVLQISTGKTGVWFRVFGYGLSAKDARRSDLPFSDRNRLGACVRIGPLLVRALRPHTSACAVRDAASTLRGSGWTVGR